MDRISDALVEAVMFIAYRDYTEDGTPEEYEDEDVRALETVASLLSPAGPAERAALAAAVERALARLPRDSEVAPYYRAWMVNMFGDADDGDSADTDDGV